MTEPYRLRYASDMTTLIHLIFGAFLAPDFNMALNVLRANFAR